MMEDKTKELTPIDIILDALRKELPPEDDHEKKQLEKWDNLKRGKVMNIFRKEKK